MAIKNRCGGLVAARKETEAIRRTAKDALSLQAEVQRLTKLLAATHVEPRKRCTTPPHLSADVQRLGAADDRETAEGYRFERLALYTESAYAFISVDPDKQEAWFKLYGGQTLRSMPAAVRTTSLTHSLAKTRLV